MMEEEIREELIQHIEFIKRLMVDLRYMDKDYNPSLKEIVDFCAAYQVLTLNKELNPETSKFNRSYLSGLRVFSDILRTIKTAENTLPDKTLDDPIERLRRSIKIEMLEDKK